MDIKLTLNNSKIIILHKDYYELKVFNDDIKILFSRLYMTGNNTNDSNYTTVPKSITSFRLVSDNPLLDFVRDIKTPSNINSSLITEVPASDIFINFLIQFINNTSNFSTHTYTFSISNEVQILIDDVQQCINTHDAGCPISQRNILVQDITSLVRIIHGKSWPGSISIFPPLSPAKIYHESMLEINMPVKDLDNETTTIDSHTIYNIYSISQALALGFKPDMAIFTRLSVRNAFITLIDRTPHLVYYNKDSVIDNVCENLLPLPDSIMGPFGFNYYI